MNAADTLLELEHATVFRATKTLRAGLKRVLAVLRAVWPGDNADELEKARAISRLNLTDLTQGLSTVEAAILAGAVKALAQGVEAGLEQVATQLPSAFKHTLPGELRTQVSATERIARAAVTKGKVLLSQATTLEQAIGAVVVASPVNRIEGHARWVTNRASNLGITAVSDVDNDVVTVWKAERDACVHCLAYQGHTRVNGFYPAGLTFGKKPLSTEKVPLPPLHPNCRCTQIVLHKDVAQAVIQGLRREAQRSILRGWSVESESQGVRVDAARRLLAKHPAMPKSVQAYARKAVAQGAFARGSQYPGSR